MNYYASLTSSDIYLQDKRRLSATQELIQLTHLNGEALSYTVSGNCMSPTLKSGDSIAVKSENAYLPGDIVVYVDAIRGQVAHRLLGNVQSRSVSKFLLKGDNSERPDPLILASKVLGRVVAVNKMPVQTSISQRAIGTINFAYWVTRIGIRKMKSKVQATQSTLSKS